MRLSQSVLIRPFNTRILGNVNENQYKINHIQNIKQLIYFAQNKTDTTLRERSVILR